MRHGFIHVTHNRGPPCHRYAKSSQGKAAPSLPPPSLSLAPTNNKRSAANNKGSNGWCHPTVRAL